MLMRCSAQLIHVYRLFIDKQRPHRTHNLERTLEHLSCWPCLRLLLHIISLPASCHPLNHGNCISNTPPTTFWPHILKSLLFEPPQAMTS